MTIKLGLQTANLNKEVSGINFCVPGSIFIYWISSFSHLLPKQKTFPLYCSLMPVSNITSVQCKVKYVCIFSNATAIIIFGRLNPEKI